jgi:hypothetical protein
MTINNKKDDLRQKKVVVCHKLASDGVALAMMCGRDEELQSSVVAC